MENNTKETKQSQSFHCHDLGIHHSILTAPSEAKINIKGQCNYNILPKVQDSIDHWCLTFLFIIGMPKYLDLLIIVYFSM